MYEKVLVKGYHYNVRKLRYLTVVFALLLSLAIYIGYSSVYIRKYENMDLTGYQEIINYPDGTAMVSYSIPSLHSLSALDIINNKSILEKYVDIEDTGYNDLSLFMLILPWILCAVVLWFLFVNRNTTLTVTDKRIHGKLMFSKPFDLPLHSVASVSTCLLKGVTVTSTAGKTHFFLVRNNKEVQTVISKLLEEKRPHTPKSTASTATLDAVDQLRKYKALLDDGIITAEEFEAKKKQLLGIDMQNTAEEDDPKAVSLWKNPNR